MTEKLNDLNLTADEVVALFREKGVTYQCPRCTSGQVVYYTYYNPNQNTGSARVVMTEFFGTQMLMCKCPNCGFVALHDIAREIIARRTIGGIDAGE